jgi:hypothetical protein
MIRAAIGLVLLATAAPVWAQDTTILIRPTQRDVGRLAATRQLPRDVADEVISFFNAETTMRLSGSTRIPPGRGIDGDVAILGGPVLVAGRISGALTVVNGDVEFEPGAVVGGDVLVVGGTIRGADDARISGEIRSYGDPLRYRREGDQLVYAPDRRHAPPRWITQREWSEERGSETGILFALGGTYNRVEGLPILLGPRADLRLSDEMRLQADVAGIFRTTNIAVGGGNLGYRARGELVVGGEVRNIGLGVRGFDQVSPVEPWPLKDFEVGWAAFLLHRDYRDYYRQRGGSIYATLRLSRELSVTAEGRSALETSLEAHNPWTLFRSSQTWRLNPAVTDGRYRSAIVSLRLDTRNDRGMPSSGAFVTAEYERGQGRDITGTLGPYFCAGIIGPCSPPALADGKLDYQRVGFDARSYLRLSPAGRLDLRLAGGGWVGGEPLPLQRRLALGYPDPLPGYGFRQFSCGGEGLPGEPALCDRAIVAQAEFRTHLGFDFGPEWASDWGDDEDHYEPFHVSGPDLVLFADAGRAWSVSRDGSSGANIIPPDRLPALGTYRTDIGIGLDFGPLGFYLARPLQHADRSVTFTVRMGRRF